MAESIEGIIERVSEGGNLLVNLVLIDINTWQTSQEVWKAWQSGVKAEGVNTANMGIYRLVDNEVVFDLLGKQGNLFMDDRFQEDTYNGILQYDFFLLPYAMKQQIWAFTGLLIMKLCLIFLASKVIYLWMTDFKKILIMESYSMTFFYFHML